MSRLVDSIEHQIHADHADALTASAILGPFWRANAPFLPKGASIIKKDVGGDTAIMYGVVRSSNGKPIEGAELDVWHTAPTDFTSNRTRINLNTIYEVGS